MTNEIKFNKHFIHSFDVEEFWKIIKSVNLMDPDAYLSSYMI